MNKYTLRITCKDEKGLIAKISQKLYNEGFNITKNEEFVDAEHGRFFMRTCFYGNCNKEELLEFFKSSLPENAEIELREGKKKKIIILVTKEHHCLSDLLIRNQFEELNCEIIAVIGNYENLKNLTEKFNIPFYHIPAEGISREEHEAKMTNILGTYDFDFIVLAKFMRILTSDFVKHFRNKIINIHHSFLPAFIGANPYRQAYDRGVKIIGATAHFVTDDLDEGPIIFQDVIKVNHSQTAKDLSIIGKDVEKKVLSNALKFVFDDKVFIDGNKTIVFE